MKKNKKILLLLSSSTLTVSGVTFVALSATPNTSEQQENPADKWWYISYKDNEYLNIWRNKSEANSNNFPVDKFQTFPAINGEQRMWFNGKSFAYVRGLGYEKNSDRQLGENNKVKNWINLQEVTLDGNAPIDNKSYTHINQINDIYRENNNNAVKTRRWKITVNNFYLPNDLSSGNGDGNGSASIYAIGRPNLKFGFFISKDLKIKPNSLKVSLVYRSKDINTGYQDNIILRQDDGSDIKGRIYNFLEDSNQKPIIPDTSISRPNDGDFNTYKKLNQSGSYFSVHKETLKLSGNNVNEMGQQGNVENFTNPNYDVYGPNNSNRLKLVNWRYYGANLENKTYFKNTIKNIFYGVKNNGNGYDNESSGRSLSVIRTFQNTDSELFNKTFLHEQINNAGAFFQGEVSFWRNGGSKNFWDSDYVPTIIVDFETENNDALLDGDLTLFNNTKSGVFAAAALEHGYGNYDENINKSTVGTDALFFFRDEKRVFSFDVNENVYSENDTFSDFRYLPKGLGYRLKFGNKTIAEIPAEVIDKAKVYNFTDTASTDKKLQIKYTATANLNSLKDKNQTGIELKTARDLNDWQKYKVEIIEPTDWHLADFFDYSSNDLYKNYSTRSTNANSTNNPTGTYIQNTSTLFNPDFRFNTFADLKWSKAGSKKLETIKELPFTKNLENGQTGNTYSTLTYGAQDVLNATQKEEVKDGIANDWTKEHFYTGTGDNLSRVDYWDKTVRDIRQTIHDIKDIKPKVELAKDIVNNRFNKSNFTQSAFEQANSAQTKTQEQINMLDAINYAFSSETSKNNFKNSINGLRTNELNENSNLEFNKGVETTNFVTNSKQQIDTAKEALNSLNKNSYKESGAWIDQNQTPIEFVQTRIQKINGLDGISAKTKEALINKLLRSNSRQEADDLMKAIENAKNLKNQLQELYTKYTPVTTQQKYEPLRKNSNQKYNEFKTEYDQVKTLIDQFNTKYNSNTVNDSELTTAKVNELVTSLNNHLAENSNLTSKYKALNQDYEDAKSTIDSLSHLSTQDKNAEKAKISNLQNQDKYKQLENFDERQREIAKVVSRAEVLDAINNLGNKISETNKKYNSSTKSQDGTYSVKTELISYYDAEANKKTTKNDIESLKNRFKSILEPTFKNIYQNILDAHSAKEINQAQKDQLIWELLQAFKDDLVANRNSFSKESDFNNKLNSIKTKNDELKRSFGQYANTPTHDNFVFNKIKYQKASSELKTAFDNAVVEASKVSEVAIETPNDTNKIPQNVYQQNSSSTNYSEKYYDANDIEALNAKLVKAYNDLNGEELQRQEEQRISNLATSLNFDYANKSNKIPYQESDLSKNELTLPEGWVKSDNGQNWTNANQQAKITNINFGKPDPVTGIVPITYEVHSTKDNFTEVKANSPQGKNIEGFDTETKRLDRIVADENQLPNLDDLFTEEEKKKLSSTISEQELKNRINAKLREKNLDAQVNDLSLNINEANGTIENVSYKLESTKVTTPKVVSNNKTAAKTVTGFNTRDLEQARINSISSAIQWEYNDKASVIPYRKSNLETNNSHLILHNSLSRQGWTTNDNGITWVSSSQEAKITNISFSEASAVTGTVKVLFSVQSTRDGFSSISKSSENVISGFKTEQERLNGLISNAQNIANLESLFDNKSDISAQSASLTLEQKLNEKFSGNKAKVKDIHYQVDNASGQINQITYKLQSTITDSDVSLQNETSENATSAGQITGFKTETQVRNELKAQVVNLDYNGKASIIPYSDSELSLENILVTEGWTKVPNQTNTYQKDHAKLTLTSIQNKNPIDGSIDVAYTLTSTRENFTNISEQFTKKITGFDTEQNRLDKKMDSLDSSQTIANLLTQEEKSKAPSEITKEQIAQKLTEKVSSESMKVLPEDVELTPNNSNGTLNVKYKLSSTKVNQANNIPVKSSKQNAASEQTISNFWTTENETHRLEELANQLSFDFLGKGQIIPYKKDQENLNVNNLTIAGFEKHIDEASQKPYWVSTQNNAKITDMTVDSVDPQTGAIKLKYTISSTKENYSNASKEIPASEHTTISGFDTEVNRLNKILDNISNLNNLTLANRSKLFSDEELDQKASANKDHLIEKLNKWLSDHGHNAEIDTDSFTSVANDENGSLDNIGFKLKSKIEGATNVVSSKEKQNLQINGFNTATKEQNRIYELANGISWDYQGKQDHVYYSTSELQKNSLDQKLNEQGWIKQSDGTYQKASEKATLKILDFVSTDPKTGNTKLSFEVSTTKLGFSDIKKSQEATIDGFKTEQQRLNGVLDQLPFLQTLFNGKIDRSKKIFDEQNNVTQEFQNEIKKIVNDWLKDHGKTHENSYAEIDNLNVGKFNQDTGEIPTITFNLKSTKENLIDVHSKDRTEQNINGFKTIKEEQQRLTQLARSLTIDYQTNLKMQKVRYSADEFNISELKLPDGWKQGPNPGEWYNEGQNGVLTNIRFSDVNAQDGTVKISYDIKTHQGDFANTTQTNPVPNTMISDFATEANRLDWILTKDPRSNGINVPKIDYEANSTNTVLNSEDKKHTVDWINSKEDQDNQNAPTRLLQKIQQWFDNQNGADVKVVNLEAQYDNENGTIQNIKYKLESTKTNLVPTQTQPKITSTNYSTSQNATGFVTASQVNKELSDALENVKNILDYSNKGSTPYTDNSTLDEANLYQSLTSNGWTKEEDSSGKITFVKDHTRLEFVNPSGSNKPFSNSNPIGEPSTNPADNSSSTNVGFKITSEWPDFKDQDDFVKNDNKKLTGFVTEKQRLNELLKQLIRGDTINDLIDNKSDKLVKDITEQMIVEALNQELAKLNNGHPDASIKAENITLTKNSKDGTIDVQFKLSSTVNGLTQDSDNNNQLKAKNPQITNNNQISGFKTNYTHVIEQFKTHGFKDAASVVFKDDSVKATITANQEQTQDPNQYTLNIKDSIKDAHSEISANWVVITPESIEGHLYSQYQQYLPKVVAHDEINGRTIVAYYLIDKDEDHANGDNLLPVSQKFYATVSDFQTEHQRLESLKNLVKDSIHNVKTSEQRRPYLPTDTTNIPNSDIGFQDTQETLNKTPNYVQPQMKEYIRDNTHGTITVTHTYQTNKENSMLYGIKDAELSNTQDKSSMLSQLGFENLSDEQINAKKQSDLVIIDTTKVVFDNYKTYLEVLTEKVNEIKNILNLPNDTLEAARTNNNYWSQDEKANYIKQLEEQIQQFKDNTANQENTIEQNDQFYHQADQAIDAIQLDLNNVNTQKKEAFESIDNLNYLNDKQKQERQKEILHSNQKEVPNSTNASTQSIVDKAIILNNAMDQLHRIVDADSILKRNRNYNKIPNSVRELYENLINNAKDLEANKSSVNGIEHYAWNKATNSPNSQDNVSLPQASEDDTHADWSADQVKGLTQLLNDVKNEILKNLNKLDYVKQQIDEMSYLSDEEKEALKARADNPDKTSNNEINDYNNVLNKAEEINKKKEDLYNEVSANPAMDHTYEYLNNSQKDQVRTDIVKSILEDDSPDSITQEAQSKIQEGQQVENYLEVEQRATDLNNSMKELYEHLNEDQSIKNDLSKYGDATEGTKSIYDELIDIANKIKENQYDQDSINIPGWNSGVQKPSDNNWNKEQIDQLNNLIDQTLEKLKSESSFKNNPYLSKEEQDQLYENVKNATSIEEIQKQVEIANRIKETKKDLINNLDQNYPHLNQDQKDAITQEIINSIIPNTPIYQGIKDSKPELETPQQVTDRAHDLDQSMESNQQLVADQQQIHSEAKYKNAPKKFKDLYDQAINASKALQKNRSDIASTNNNIEDLWDSSVTKPENSNAQANDHKANWTKAQVDQINTIINDLLEQMEQFKGQISGLQDKIDELEYLSKEEKDKFKNQLENTENPEDADKIWEQAQKDNQAKKDVVNSILENQDLNKDQKEHFKDQITKTPLHDDELSENQSSITDLQDQAKDLNDKMNELKEIIDTTSQLTKESAFEENASKEAQNAFEKAIQDGLDTINGKAINDNTDANLNKDQIQDLIDKIKSEHDRVIDDIIDNLDGLIESEKPQIKEDIHNQVSEKDILTELAKAKDISDSVNELIDKANQYFNSNNPKLIDDINDLAKHLDDLEVKTKDFIQTKDAIGQYHDLVSALEQYRNSSIEDPNYQEIKEKLEKKIKDIKFLNPSQYPKLNDLINQINSSLKKYQAQGEDEMALVEALRAAQKEHFNKFIDDLNKRGDFNKYNDFAKTLNEIQYFGKILAGRADDNQLLQSIWSELSKLKFDNISNVLESALMKNFNELRIAYENMGFLWWIFLATNSSLVLAIIIALAKRKNKK
ncbi:hypothetical protein [Mycoplasmopsis sturni]|uniref:hypothetical protein n=1 Tax=Mycoplasmopsis sturni TaxID=39047 RepID=UPI0005662A90|nr:hypothetical protein [Mycoplasmopsis sturni]